MTVKRPTIASEALTSGTLMEKAIRQAPAPSTVAASRTERSMAWRAA